MLKMYALFNAVRTHLYKGISTRDALMARQITTSTKKSDTATATAVTKNPVEGIGGATIKPAKRRDWITLGYDIVDERKDLFITHMVGFWGICIFMWGFIFWGSYATDPNLRDWAQREAFIELRKREILGLPLVSPDYVDPATINLPPDELLGDDDIII